MCPGVAVLAGGYRYGAEHLLASYTDPTGLTFHFVYDDEHRCIETWGDRPGTVDRALSPRLSPFLADGRTPAKGVYHLRAVFYPDDFSEITTSSQTESFQGNDQGLLDKIVSAGGVTSREYDEQGFVLTRTDAIGATTTWARDARGRVLEETDALGRAKKLVRNTMGRVTEMIDEGGHVWRAWYDARGNLETLQEPTGAVTAYQYDRRGLLTEAVLADGGRTLFEYDSEGNMVRAVEADGAEWRATYDGLGQKMTMTDPGGATTTFAYDDRGYVTSVVDKRGAHRRYERDGMGNLTRVTDPDGVSVTMEYGGNQWLTAVGKPDGTSYRILYDRDGNAVDVVNERGAVHQYVYTAAGFLASQRHFDGREERYRWDLMGRLAEYENGLGVKTEFEYDLVANLIERRFGDGVTETFEWSATDTLLRTTSPDCDTLFQRDAVGRTLSERHVFDGADYEVSTTYDPVGRVSTTRTSRGHEKRLDRNPAGEVLRVVLDGRAHDIERDAVGRELKRSIGAGAHIDSQYDPLGSLVRRTVTSSSAHKPVGREPEWVGVRRGGYSVDHAYRYGLTGELLQAWDQLRGLTAYENDALGNLRRFLPDGGPPELFAYDETENITEANPKTVAREYDSGNRLIQKGDVEFEWNDDGQLVRRTRRTPEGDEIWEYEWTAKGLLGAVIRPDGSRIDFRYDVMFRRISKTTTLVDDDGAAVVGERVHFVSDGDILAHEIRIAGQSANRVVAERTYYFDDGTFEPWAHRDVAHVGGGSQASDWYHYVNDPAGTPSVLVDSQGEVACTLERKAFALDVHPGATSTPLRFLGQYHDEEIGLAYHRFRYYDADIARFVSADPMGLSAGNNVFQFVPNANDWVDPWGLGVADKLGRAMKKAGHPCRPGETPHHIVEREGGGTEGDRARAVLKRNKIGIDSAPNGARLKGTAESQKKKGGHKSGCKGYHAGTDIHSDASQGKIADALEKTESDSKAAGDTKAETSAKVAARLSEIGRMQERRKPGNRLVD